MGANYAQQLHSDLISQALHNNGAASGGIGLPPVPDSPSLQQQNMPRKQPIKARLGSR